MSSAGFRIPIHSSLTQPIMMGGVPRKFAILNGTMLFAITLGLHQWWGIVLFLVAHVTARHFSKQDPYFFEVLIRHLRQKTYYSA